MEAILKQSHVQWESILAYEDLSIRGNLMKQKNHDSGAEGSESVTPGKLLSLS